MGSSYDRAARSFTFQKATGTSTTVGPGVYEVNRSSLRLGGDGYAPFNSLTTRNTFLTPSDAVIAAPGPGQYDINGVTISPNYTGISALQSKAPRFRQKKEDLPGPGQYETVTQWKKSDRPAKSFDAKQNASGSRVRLERKADAPSIPMPSQAYGYEETNDGQLVRQAPPRLDTTLGPAYYNPRVSDVYTTKKYKGCHWSKQKSKRSEIIGHDGPGPADYNPIVDNLQHDLHEKLALHTMGLKTELNVPRLMDQVVAQSKKQHVPGPGAYNVKSFTEQKTATVNEDGLLVEHPPFGVASRRFQMRIETIPGPGAYNDPRHALNTLNKVSGLKKNPFGQTALRFTDNPDGKLLPGPGAYSVDNGLATASLKAAWQASTRKGGFGSTATRDSSQQMMGGETQAPGPGAYEVPDKPVGGANRYSQPLSSMFASHTRRDFSPTELDVEEKPPPGAYNVVDSYAKSQGRRPTEPPRNDAARKRNQSFVSSAPRFVGKLFATAGFGETPGPAAYDSSISALNNNGGKFVTMGQRFKTKQEDMPGPGQYELSPTVGHSVLKNTFNVTLNNPLIAQALVI